jgi:outer membrane protein TolC
VEAPADVAALIEEAKRTREDRRAIEARVLAAAARRAAAGGAARPNVAVAAGVDYSRPNPQIFPRAAEWNDSWDVSVNASWSLFDGGRVRADVATAEANERAARERLNEFDSLLELEIRQRQVEVESSRARVASAADAVTSATDSRRVLQNRYNAGVVTSLEVLDAQAVLLDAELQRTRALAAVRLAQAELERAIGR